MKVNPRIIILLTVCTTLYSKAAPPNLPTDEQVTKLVEAAWKQPVSSIDITLYKEIEKPPVSEDKIRKMFEDAFKDMEGLKENLSPAELEMRNRDIQLNVERTLKEQEVGRKIKERIRIDGHRQRIDQAIGWPKMVLLEGTPHELVRPAVILGPNTPYDTTYVNSGDERKGDYTSFTYFHENKNAQITNNRKTVWTKSDIIEFARLASSFQGFLGVNKGTIEAPVFVPDPNKIEKLVKTGLLTDRTYLTIMPDPNNSASRDRIEIKDANHSCGTIMICDREDYSRVYHYKICMPTTGKVLYVIECNNFDSQGFPHNITKIQYDKDGNFKEKAVYRIEKVQLNPVITEEVFAFSPPVDYEVVELDANNISHIVREKGGIDGAMRTLLKAQKEKDVETLTGLLGHEIWQIRLRSLQVLEHLLAQNKEDLKEAASILKNDENSSVREKAASILQRIESNK